MLKIVSIAVLEGRNIFADHSVVLLRLQSDKIDLRKAAAELRVSLPGVTGTRVAELVLRRLEVAVSRQQP